MVITSCYHDNLSANLNEKYWMNYFFFGKKLKPCLISVLLPFAEGGNSIDLATLSIQFLRLLGRGLFESISFGQSYYFQHFDLMILLRIISPKDYSNLVLFQGQLLGWVL